MGKIAERIPSVKVGPGSEPDSEMGPLVTAEHRQKVVGYVEAAGPEGATVVVDGGVTAPPRTGSSSTPAYSTT